MEATYPAKAIILKREPRGDNDSRVVVFTRERGRLDLVARGTGKPKSKLSGHLEPFCITDIMVVKGKRYDYIGSAVSKNCLPDLKTDLDKLIAVGRAISTFSSLVKENLKQEELYELIQNYLNLINTKELAPRKAEPFTDYFILKLLTLLGHRPELDRCVNCRKMISPNGNYFDFNQGGIICGDCAGKIKSKTEQVTISNDCIKMLRSIISDKFGKLKAIDISDELRKEINYIVLKFKEFQI